jgi:PAS domain S-box-containing protein
MAGKKKTIRNKSHATSSKKVAEWETALAAFMNASVDAFVLFDKKLNLLGINPAGERLVGLTKDTARASIGRNLLELLPYIAKTERYEKYLGVLKTGEPFIADDLVMHPIFGNIHLSVKAFKAGDGLGIIASDITERKRIEDALANSEEWHRALVDTAGKAGLGITIVQNTQDREAAIVFANDEYCRMSGYSLYELLSTTAWDLIAPSDLSAIQDRYRRRQRGEDVTSYYRETILRKDGSFLPTEAGVSLMTYQGKVATVSYYMDITERNRMERALAESEERYRALVDTAGKAGLGIEIVRNTQEREAVVVFVNDEYCRMMGYSREELLGMSEWALVSPDDLGMVQERYRRRQKGEDVTGFYEITMLRKDGTELPIETSVKTMTYQGKIATVSYFRDITERKQAEEALQKAREDLEIRVDERTKELATTNEALRNEIIERKRVEEKLQKLYEQEKELRQQLEDEMKRRVEFTRALAHELKTPLTPMLISSQALEAELKDELLLGLATNISRGALNLNSRIDELLDMAKGEIGMLRLKAEPLDVLQLLREVVDYVSPVAFDRGQTLVTELPNSLPLVKADEVRLRQIVLNLLNNALKFTQEGGKIILRVTQKADSLIIEVEDNGPGIDDKEQAHLFEPYRRLEASEERLSGLGLGLALCKTLVELHGGKIWAKSQAGKGSIFTFSIPLK